MPRAKKTDLSGWLDKGVDLEGRRICLIGEVSEETVSPLIKALIVMGEGSDPIHFYLHTEGGDVDAGFALFDAIKRCECEVLGHVLNAAYSMGAILLQACDRRSIAPLGALMVHIGEEGQEGHPTTVRSWIRHYDRLSDRMVDILSEKMQEKNPFRTREAVRELLQFDTIYTAEEAVQVGLVDEIV